MMMMMTTMMDEVIASGDDSISIEKSVTSVLNDLKQTLDEEDARLKQENNFLFNLNDSLTTSEETQSSSRSESLDGSNIIILKKNNLHDLDTALNVETNSNKKSSSNNNHSKNSSSHSMIGNREENTEIIEIISKETAQKPDKFIFDETK